MFKHASANRFYRLVWSNVNACWVAVAEGTRGRGKSARKRTAAAVLGGLLASTGALAAAPPEVAVHALPKGVQVVAGQAQVATNGSAMTVNQASAQAILNWQSFDIGANASVRFNQPSTSAVALNRVIGTDPSRIYGQLSSNGKVFLINTNGVLFGATHNKDDPSTDVRAGDHERNLATLAEGRPHLAARLADQPLSGRAAVRATRAVGSQ